MIAGWWLSPMARRQMIAALEKEFDSKVEIGSLSVGFFPQPHGTVERLVLRKRDADPSLPPMIRIRRAEARSTWPGLLGASKKVRLANLEGLEITLARGREDDSPETGEDSGAGERPGLEVAEITADGTVLRILPKDPGKEPLVWDIYKLRLKSVGAERPLHFDAQLRNAKPPGLIETSGEFGPWNARAPRRTAVKGTYRFANADLGDFKGIAGKLFSTGKFDGVLERLEVRGTTDTPDFMVTSAGNPVDLKTEFSATVDGTSGDTLLHPVIATFGGTTVKTEGGVTGKPGEKGKTVRLNAVVQNGYLADVLKLGVKKRPPMTGRISFRSLIEIPPGDRDIMQKLHLDGRFDIEAGKFTSAETQKKISGLSERAQGDPEGGGDADVLSNLRGRFRLKGGVITMNGLQFGVPGADIRLNGTYALEGGALDFRGTARTDAKVSQMTTGWKSFLLKALDPFFKKQQAGAVIPIHIGGTREDPSFGLRLH